VLAGPEPIWAAGIQPCCGADASSSRRTVTSSRIIAGGVVARYLYVIVSRSEFVRSCLWISIQSSLAVSSARLRSVQFPRKSDWTMCCNCPGQMLHTAWDISNPRSAGQKSMDWSVGVDSNIWPSIEDSGTTSARAVAWAAASVSYCSTCSAHKSKLRGSLMSKTGGLDDPRGLDYNSGVGTRY